MSRAAGASRRRCLSQLSARGAPQQLLLRILTMLLAYCAGGGGQETVHFRWGNEGLANEHGVASGGTQMMLWS